MATFSYLNGKITCDASMKIQTPYDVILEFKEDLLTEKEKNWLVFLYYSEYERGVYHFMNPTQSIATILLMYTPASIKTTSKILSESMNIPDYCPWLGQEIPLDKYSDEISRIIKKRQDEFFDEMFYRREYGRVLVQGYRREILFDAREYGVQRQLYDLVVLLRGDSRIIYSKNDLQLIDYLNELDPETWVIDVNPIHNFQTIRNKKKSTIDFKNPEVLQALKEVLE